MGPILVGEAGLVEEGAAVAVLDLDHPEVGVEAALAGEGGLDLGVGAVGDLGPDAGAGGVGSCGRRPAPRRRGC